MTGLDIVGLLKDYGPWGISALLILGLVYVHKGREADAERATTRHDAAVERYTRQLETLMREMAVTIERSSATSAAVHLALESRTGIFERLSQAVEQARAESRSLITDLKNHGVTNDAWTREKLDDAAKRIDTILARIEDLRREVGR